MDKVLALRGGGELVALWAQLASAIDAVSGVVMSGIALGLAVLVAQTADPQRQRELRGHAMALGLAVALPVAAAAMVLGWGFFGPLSAAAALSGWVAVIPGLLNGYWLGQQRRDCMLALAAGSALVACAAALAAPRSHVLEVLALSQVLPALALLLVARPSLELAAARRTLGRYVLPGLAVGVLGPLSMLAARGVVAEAMSWHEAGVLQALWRTSDWVCGFAGGVLSVHYLPRFAAARTRAELAAEMRRAAKAVLIASAAVFAVMLAFHRELLAWLYDPGVRASHSAAALIFAGSLVRIASWIALFALYAVRATAAIALGELLSLPLFAGLLALSGRHLSLELAGWLWLLSFSAYAAFNFGAAFRRRRDAAAS